MDEVFIRDLSIKTLIGVNEWERKKPQKILVNIHMFAEVNKDVQKDDIKDCIDYSHMAEKIKSLIRGSSRFTVEALAEDLAGLCLEHPKIKKVIIRVEKPGIIRGISSVGVQIER
jgi:FolB domain-containing protein